MNDMFNKPALFIVLTSLFFSLASLGIYLDEPGYPDAVLFSLLAILRYSSFILCLSAVFLLINSTIQTIRKPSVLSAALIVLSFFCALYGASMVILEAVTITFAGGLE